MSFVLDSSGSIKAENWPKILTFVNAIVDELDITPTATKVSAVVYSTSARVEFHLNKYNDKTSVKSGISAIPWATGSTHTDLGLNLVESSVYTSQNGERSGVRNIAIVITDGKSTGPAATVAAASNVRAKNIELYSIGISGFDVKELIDISGANNRVFTVANFDQLLGLKERVLAVICGTQGRKF